MPDANALIQANLVSQKSETEFRGTIGKHIKPTNKTI